MTNFKRFVKELNKLMEKHGASIWAKSKGNLVVSARYRKKGYTMTHPGRCIGVDAYKVNGKIIKV